MPKLAVTGGDMNQLEKAEVVMHAMRMTPFYEDRLALSSLPMSHMVGRAIRIVGIEKLNRIFQGRLEFQQLLVPGGFIPSRSPTIVINRVNPPKRKRASRS